MRSFLSVVLLSVLATPVLGDEPRSIVVSGSAEIMTVPDLAELRFAAEARAAAIDEARERVDTTVTGVTRLADRMQIPREHVTTAALVVQPDYEWRQDTRRQKLVGYIVTRRMTVRLSELDRLGDVLEGLLALGVNRVEPPVFDSSERESLELRALGDAARDARRRAEVLAQALDARVGEVRHLESAARPGIYRGPERALAAAAEDQTAGYQPGQISITSQVTVTFDLLTR